MYRLGKVGHAHAPLLQFLPDDLADMYCVCFHFVRRVHKKTWTVLMATEVVEYPHQQ
jgi:hypothetical protein